MKAHALIANNIPLVIVENMHKEVIVITEREEVNSCLPYDEAIRQLENGVIDAGRICMVHAA